MEKQESSVDRIYAQVSEMAVNFEFKPDERINEGKLAKQVGSSRTPLREALNRLVAGGFLKFQTNQGFFCRSLDPKAVFDLYNARQAIETEGIRLAIDNATNDEITAIEHFLDSTEPEYSSTSSSEKLIELDEGFHIRLVRLSGNFELERILENLNARIRFIRQIDMNVRRSVTPDAHRRILAAVFDRDHEKAIFELRDHISRRREDANLSVQQAFSKLYVPASSSFPSTPQ
jgi:DNA-binding GntR family transcriptional regulator